MKFLPRDLRWAMGTLKVRITVGGIVVLMLSIGLVMAMVLQAAERDLLKAQRQREMSDTVRTAATLARTTLNLQYALERVSTLLDQKTIEDDAALERFIHNTPVLSSMFTSLFVATPSGQVQLVSSEDGLSRPHLDISRREFFRRSMAEGKPFISLPFAGQISGEPTVVFTQPVRNAHGIFAVLGGALRLSSRDLLEGLVDPQSSDESTLIVVTDANGLILAHPDKSLLMRPLSKEPRLAQALAAWRAEGGLIEAGGEILPQDGEMVSAAGVPGPGWVVWRTRPEVELLEPFQAAQHQSLKWVVALILLLSFGLFLFIWRLLRPLSQLEKRARHLFDGVQDMDAGWPTADNEIGRLGQVLRQVSVQRVEFERLNTEALVRLNSVMRAAPVGIAFVRNHRFELVGSEFCRLSGYSQEELLGQSAARVFSQPQDYATLTADEQKAFDVGGAYVGEWQMRRGDGKLFWVRLRSKQVDSEDADQRAIWTLNDIDDQRSAREALEWLAAHDGLTELANRQSFERRARQLVTAMPHSLPAALVYIDLDRFKQINDTAGHLSGDAVLRAVAQALTGSVRAGDLVARLGGDEFALLLEQCDQASAQRIAELVVARVSAIALPSPGEELRIGASAGVASLTPTLTVTEWLHAADAACYAAKAAGRGVVRTSPTLESPMAPSHR